MELRAYLQILRRRRAVIIAATLIVAIVAFLVSSLKTSLYTASAQVLLRPNDPSEQIDQTNQPNVYIDPDRYVAAQLDIVRGEAVAEAALRDVNGVTPQRRSQVYASQAGATDIINVSAVDPDPARAAETANAVAAAYIENRRQKAVDGLEKASGELQTKLDELEARISDLDQQIAGGAAAQIAAHQRVLAARKPVVKLEPRTQPDGKVIQVPVPQPLPADTFTPVTNEALEAGRSAATVQYQSLYGQQQNLLVTKSLKKGEAELITAAGVPTTPSSPRPKRDLALGLSVGLLLGLGIAFLREQLDDRIHSREQVEEITKLPVIAELPVDQESARNPTGLAVHDRGSGALAEAARGLRTSMTFLGVDAPLRRIIVTSAGPGDGKSFTAANLAAVYAQAGLRTVLVSADLRRPRLESMFPEIGEGPGLTEVIAGITASKQASNGNDPVPLESGLAKLLRPTHVEGLFVLPTGKLPPNPAELLGSKRAVEVLDELSGFVDVVVVDSPPILVVTDASVLAQNADGVLLVVAWGETHKRALMRAVSTLTSSHARLLGVVLNKVAASGSSYYEGYYGYSAEAATQSSRLPWRRRRLVASNAGADDR